MHPSEESVKAVADSVWFRLSAGVAILFSTAILTIAVPVSIGIVGTIYANQRTIIAIDLRVKSLEYQEAAATSDRYKRQDAERDIRRLDQRDESLSRRITENKADIDDVQRSMRAAR